MIVQDVIIPNNPDLRTINVKTKKGKLIVTTTVEDSKIQNVTIAKDSLDPDAVIKSILLPSEKPELKPEVVSKVVDENDPGTVKVKQIKKTSRVDFNRSSLERNFITPNRAMSDFLLKAADLDTLPKTKRRSPYEQEPPITVYWRKDVEAKAIEVWGTRENLLRECLKREIERKKHQQSKIFVIFSSYITNTNNFRYFHCKTSFKRLPKRNR